MDIKNKIKKLNERISKSSNEHFIKKDTLKKTLSDIAEVKFTNDKISKQHCDDLSKYDDIDKQMENLMK